MPKLIIILLFLTLFHPISPVSKNCLSGCEQCLEPKSLCISCRNDFELSTNGECIPSNSIPNCSKYQNKLICSTCRPSFRLHQTNRCMKMNDGCLEPGKLNLCSNCIENAILDKITSTCMIHQLNCEQLGRNRKCIKCKQNYRLDPTKNACILTSSSCLRTDETTGLCTVCANNFTLIGFECLKTPSIANLANCYLATENRTSRRAQCIYCKQGYLLINGMCIVRSLIVDGNKRLNCSETNEYVEVSDSTCRPVTKNCKFFDYGFKRCVFCDNGRVLMDGICKKDIHKNCLTFSPSNPQLCLTCKQKYHLNQDSECISFPPFCEEVSSNGKCIRCIDTFLLSVNSLLCVDPNCFQINRSNGQCNQCKSNYIKNLQGICIFVDPNCQEKLNQICVKCKENFLPNTQTAICQFKDPNCATFSNKNICLQCNLQFYYNINSQRCLKLPQNCQSASQRGQCRQCAMGFALTSGRQCLRINSIPNCKIGDSRSPNLCLQCELQYYLTLRKTCELLPSFCLQFDAGANRCINCDNSKSILQNGICKDRNCEFADSFGTCLGCFQGYEFGQRGECQPLQRDQKCKEFLHNQCRVCSDRHYFDKNWHCVSVSALCQTYNENSGLCTSCYMGYRLSQQPEGECITGDVVFNPCKEEDKKTGDCTKCVDAYELARTNDTKKVLCTKIDLNLSNSCLEYKNKKCSRCIGSRFLKNGQCEQIDQNCKKYDNKTGQCEQCNEGYELKVISTISTNSTKSICLFKSAVDLKCKTFDKNHSSLCVECYSGYQVSSETSKCEPFEDFCQVRNQQGQCAACFMGYVLLNNLCIVAPPQISRPQNQMLPVEACLTPKAADPKMCEKCIWGYVNKEGVCLKKDLNCNIFKDPNSSLQCVECFGGYTVLPNNPNICVLEIQIDKNCQKYDDNNICTLCKTGYKLQSSTNPQQSIQLDPPRCQSTRNDINCIKYREVGGCEQCLINMVITQNGKCEYPLYGFDVNCELYKNKICDKCKQNFTLNQSFICTLQL